MRRQFIALRVSPSAASHIPPLHILYRTVHVHCGVRPLAMELYISAAQKPVPVPGRVLLDELQIALQGLQQATQAILYMSQSVSNDLYVTSASRVQAWTRNMHEDTGLLTVQRLNNSVIAEKWI